MSEMPAFDVVVIGSGSAGEKAAIQSSKLGKKVAIVEAGKIGGVAIHSGTVPSKTLREAILDLSHFRERSFYGSDLDEQEISIKDLNYRVNWVSEHIRETTTHQLRKNRIAIYMGFARFKDPHTLEILDPEGNVKETIEAKSIILTCGSRPRIPNNVPCNGRTILTSSEILALDHLPASLAVVGAGVIGAEFASMFSILGTKVTLIDKRSSILSFVDREIASHLKIFMESSNLVFMGNKEYTHIESTANGVTIKFSDNTEVSAEMALIAAGREANLDGMQIENAGLRLNENGFLSVDDEFRTNVDHIFAAGDIIQGPSLSATGILQGRFAAKNACGVKCKAKIEHFPYGIYTIPDISYIGLTEEMAREKGLDYEVGRSYAYENPRCLISGEEVGLCKLIFDRKNLRLLGASIIGRAACEMIHIAQLAISFNASIEYFVDNVFNVPTYAESYRIAALNGLNKQKTNI